MRQNLKSFGVVGKTDGGRGVVGGTFPLVNSEGIPLDVLVGALDEKSLVVDWLDFMIDAVYTGWNPKTTKTKIVSACSDAVGKEYADGVAERIDEVHRIWGI